MTEQEKPAEATETPTAPEQLTAEQREDAYLMEHDGADEDDGAEAEAAPETAEPEEAPVEAQAETEEPAETEESSDIDTDALEEAWSVLRRDGFKQDDLALLSDEAVLRLAGHRKKVQGDVERLLSETKPNSQEQNPTESEAPVTAEATTGQPNGDHLQQAAKSFADYVGLDDEGAKLLAQSYQQLVTPLTQQVQAMQNYIAEQQIEAARQNLAGQFPQVADKSSDDYGRVINRMNKLFSDGSHKDLQKLMEDAIAFEFRDQIRQQASEANTKLRNLRTNGTPVEAKGAQPQPEMSAEELEDQVLQLLESGAPDAVERARRLTGR